MAEHLGDRLVRLRRSADLTQEGLAEKSGVSSDVIKRLEQRRAAGLTVEDMRLLIRQDVGLAYLLPLAVEVLPG